MAFYALDFVLDNIPSETYGLKLTMLGDSGESTSSAGSDIELITDKVFRRPVQYFYGVEQTPVLQFPLSFNLPSGEITAVDSYNIEKWLFGSLNYRKLQIMQPDMEGVYFNCFFTEPQVQRVGNIIVGYNCNVVCDSPFAWEFARTNTYNFTSLVSQYAIDFFNISDNQYYLFPSIEFTMDNIGGNFQIVNQSESNRASIFTTFVGNEVVSVNNDIQVISSSLSLLRLSNFNKKWLRLIPGKNSLLLTGNISQFKMTFQFARKVGG